MLGKVWFFSKTFLLANTSITRILKIVFFTFGNINIQFAKKKLIWRFYTTKKALSTTQQVELIDKKKFV